MDTHPGHPRPGPSPRHITLWFYFLNVSKISSCSSIQAVITLDQAWASSLLLSCNVLFLISPHVPACLELIFLKAARVMTGKCQSDSSLCCFQPLNIFLSSWSEDWNLQHCLQISVLAQAATSPASCHFLCFSWLIFFPLTHYFFSCSFWNNFRHAKCCKTSAKIFHMCFTQLP